MVGFQALGLELGADTWARRDRFYPFNGISGSCGFSSLVHLSQLPLVPLPLGAREGNEYIK